MKLSFKLLLLTFLFAAIGLKAQTPTYPAAYNLSNDFSLTSFDPATTAGNYPANMVFHYTNFADPFADKESYSDYVGAYNGTSGTRITGLGDYGFQFTNSGSGTNPNKLGDAVLALNTTGRTVININWTGRTTASGASSYRTYKLSLQYRIGNTGAWTIIGPEYTSVLAAITTANPASYQSQTFTNIQLPSACDDKPLVQLRWMYNYVSGSGTRPSLTVDDIGITSLSSSGIPTKLALESISPIKVLNGLPFTLKINTVGDDNAKKGVYAATQIVLSKIMGDGTLAPLTELTKTMAIGDNTLSFANLILDLTGAKKLRVQAVSGVPLTSVDIDLNVLQSPYILNFDQVYPKGHVGLKLPRFYVTANNANTSLNTDFNSNVTVLIKNTTTGQIYNNTVKAVNGVATFSNVYFDQPGHYLVQANSNGVIYSNNTSFDINPAPVFTEVKIPSFMIGYTGSGDGFNWRVPAYALIKIENLHPNTEYRYNTRALDAANTQGPEYGVGACLYFDEVRDSSYYSSKYGATNNDTMSAPLPFSAFMTDGTGTKNLWINIVPNTYVAVFANNRNINWVLNLGSEKGSILTRYRTTGTTKTLNFGSSATNKATGIADANSGMQTGHYVGLYSGTGTDQKLASIAYVQDDGTDLSDYNRVITPWQPYAPSGPDYYKNLDHVNGSWATIIPNTMTNGEGVEVSAGLTKIEEYDNAGNVIRTWTDADGIWAGVNTNNANGGMTSPINMFETPNMGNIQFVGSSMTNVCNNHPVTIHCNTYGVQTVNIEYTEDNGTTWEIIASQVPVVNEDGMDAVHFVWNFENFRAYDKAVKLRVVCNEHDYINAVTNTFYVYNQPVVNQISGGGQFCKDQQVVMLCTATGSNINYQWRKDGVSIVGATNPTYVINSTTFDDSGIYTCLITNNGYCDVIESNGILVYVETDTKIIQDPKNTFAKAGNKAIFEVKAHTIGAAPDFIATYQWYNGTMPLTDANGKYSGSMTSMLVINKVTSEDALGSYWCKVTGLCSNASSNEATLEIVNIEITDLTEDQAICENTPLNLSVTATSGNAAELTYSWLKDGKETGITTANFAIANVRPNDAGIYTVKVIDAVRGFYVVSNEINVVVNQAPVIITQPQATNSVSQGTVVKLEVAVNSISTCQYQWYKDNAVIDGETQNTLEIAVISAAQEGTYHCVVSNDCGTIQTANSTITLIPGGSMLSVNDKSKDGYILYAPTPNPVNGSTLVKYYIPNSGRVTFTVRDAFGREIATIFDEIREAGCYELNIDAANLKLSSGTYFYSIQSNNVNLINKMTVIR